jgi:hypothetical protein
MTTERDFDRVARAWLDLMPSEAPDRTVESVLQAVATAPQVRRWPWTGQWRPNLNRLTIIAATVALLVVAIGGAMLLSSGRQNLPVQTPTPEPMTVTPAPTSEAPVAFDETLWGSWAAEAPPIPGLPSQGSRIQTTFSWDDGVELVVQTSYENGYRALTSDALPADPGEFRVRSQSTVDGCQGGDVGTYTWTRSTNGLFLTVAAVDDACAIRATTLTRTWVRTLGAVNDGGTGMALMTDPYPDMLVTLPKLTFGMPALPPVDIGTFREGDPELHFTIFLNPLGLADGCATGDQGSFQIDKTPAALRTYIAGLPTTNVTSIATTIGGLAARHITADSTAGTCAAGDMTLFKELPFPTSNGGPGEIKFALGEKLSLWAVVVDTDLLVLAYTGPGVSTADEQAIMDTIQFTNGLPTP